MATTIESMDDVLKYISRCTDIELAAVSAAIIERKRRMHQRETQRKLAELKPGDLVQINQTVKPKYLAGATGKIHARKNGKFVVHLDEDCDARAISRFGRAPICPASLLEKI